VLALDGRRIDRILVTPRITRSDDSGASADDSA
jgi:hypothetical protein